MKKIFLSVSRRLTRKTLALFGLGSACFMIAACYGTPQADYEQMPVRKTGVTGKVKLNNNAPGANAVVKLISGDDTLLTLADAEGMFTFNNISPAKTELTLLAAAGDQSGSAIISVRGDGPAVKNHVADITLK